jgi:hypothetical protein
MQHGRQYWEASGSYVNGTALTVAVGVEEHALCQLAVAAGPGGGAVARGG